MMSAGKKTKNKGKKVGKEIETILDYFVRHLDPNSEEAKQKKSFFRGMFEGMDLSGRELWLSAAKLHASLAPEDRELREKAVAAIDMHETRVVEAYNDPEKCPHPEMSGDIRKVISILGELTKKANLSKIKKLLTPYEYEEFIPIYVEFKKTGKFTIINPHVRD